MTERAIVATFFRSAVGITRLHAVTVVSDFTCSDGRTVRSRDYYDVDWSKRSGCYLFNKSGSGGREPVEVQGLFFTSGPVEIRREPPTWCSARGPIEGPATRRIRRRNPTRRMMTLPGHITLEPGQDLLDWLQGENIEQDAVFCSECSDMVRGDYLCEHTWWCDKISWYSTPSDPCGHAGGEDCWT